MKKFLFKIGFIILLITLIDFVLGGSLKYMLEKVKGGDNARNNYISTKVKPDVVILGSSRAFHHYNPVIITDSMKMSCYNCGQGGCGTILAYGRLKMIYQRHHPKFVIYDVFPPSDYLVGENNSRQLGYLRPYYDQDGIPEIFEIVDKTERIKMLSLMYQFNSRFVQIVSDFVRPLKSEGISGYVPHNKELDKLKLKKQHFNSYSIDSVKYLFMEKLVNEFSDSKFIFVVSPTWYGWPPNEVGFIREFCQSRNIRFIDYSRDKKYIHNDSLFMDGNHLNWRGADEFTKDLMRELH